jgi:hypothetical protein
VALRKVAKKQAAECTEEARRLEARRHLIPLMEKFEIGKKALSSLEALSAQVLKEILKFFYNVKLKGIATMKKADMVQEVVKRVVVQPHRALLVPPAAGPPGTVVG